MCTICIKSLKNWVLKEQVLYLIHFCMSDASKSAQVQSFCSLYTYIYMRVILLPHYFSLCLEKTEE